MYSESENKQVIIFRGNKQLLDQYERDHLMELDKERKKEELHFNICWLATRTETDSQCKMVLPPSVHNGDGDVIKIISETPFEI